MKKLIVFSLVLLILLGGMVSWEYSRVRDGKLHIVTCNVGQGMAILIRTPSNKDILFDAGPGDAVLTCLGKYLPFWDRTIDLVILSHPHADHYEGLFSILERYEVKAFATEGIAEGSTAYSDLIDQLRNKQIPLQKVFAGDQYQLQDGVILHMLAPDKEDSSYLLAESDKNERSVIMELTYQEFSMLFTGDSPAQVVEESIGYLDVDVLQVPHHGSKTGLDEDTLSHIKPELAIIAVGKKNRYGHPHAGIMQLLQAANIPTMRTDQDGNIHITSDGRKWWVD